MFSRSLIIFYKPEKSNNQVPATSYKAFLYWCLIAGLMIIGFYIAWDLGVLLRIILIDVTYICVVILFLFTLSSGHCAYRSWYLSRQDQMLSTLAESIERHKRLPVRYFNKGQSHAEDYLRAIQSDCSKQDKMVLTETLAEFFRGSHQVGWFITGIIIKLGLLGTVIGFVLMLSSISGLEELDISDIKQLMQQMTQGMGVAMNTTMVGLVASMLLGVQYTLLDRSADRLLVETIQLSQQLSVADGDQE